MHTQLPQEKLLQTQFLSFFWQANRAEIVRYVVRFERNNTKISARDQPGLETHDSSNFDDQLLTAYNHANGVTLPRGITPAMLS